MSICVSVCLSVCLCVCVCIYVCVYISQEKACSTFNFLNADRRAVVAAIIPPTYVELTDKERELYDLREVEKEQRENVFEPFVEIKEDDRFIKVGVNPKLFEDLNTRQPNDRK